MKSYRFVVASYRCRNAHEKATERFSVRYLKPICDIASWNTTLKEGAEDTTLPQSEVIKLSVIPFDATVCYAEDLDIFWCGI